MKMYVVALLVMATVWKSLLGRDAAFIQTSEHYPSMKVNSIPSPQETGHNGNQKET